MKQQIDLSNVYTQAAYARKISKARSRVNQLVQSGEVKSLKINGSVLVYDDKL